MAELKKKSMGELLKSRDELSSFLKAMELKCFEFPNLIVCLLQTKIEIASRIGTKGK